MWTAVKRVLKPRGAFVTTASQPFTSALVMSNTAWFKYCWVWEKTRPTGFANAKIQPLRVTEDVVVFSENSHTYNPQGTQRVNITCHNSRSTGGGVVRGNVNDDAGKGSMRTPQRAYLQEFTNYPKNVLRLPLDELGKLHPTQKPVALYAYLIRTYTNEGDTVLDMCMGSGTTGVACIQTGRNFIGIELDHNYAEIARKRCEEASMQLRLI
jgi:site-specific DNA-methyltransferase (adenine-specific)